MRTFVFKSDKNGQHYFRVLAKNGEVIAESEGYENRQDALDTAALIRQGETDDAVEALRALGYTVIPPHSTDEDLSDVVA